LTGQLLNFNIARVSKFYVFAENANMGDIHDQDADIFIICQYLIFYDKSCHPNPSIWIALPRPASVPLSLPGTLFHRCKNG